MGTTKSKGSSRPSRREIIKRGAAIAGGVWLTPSVRSWAQTATPTASPQPCPPGTYGFRLNQNADCVSIPVGNASSCLNTYATNGCGFIVGLNQTNPLIWSVTVVGTITSAAVQCNGFKTHPCVKGTPNGLGISVVDNGDGTQTATFDCNIADPHTPHHGISHIEMLTTC